MRSDTVDFPGSNGLDGGPAGFSRQVIEASPSGMILVDAHEPDMPILFVNDAFIQTTGYSFEEAVGRNCRFMHGDDRDQPGLQVIREALAKQQACSVTLRNYRKDGTLFWNELRISPLHDDDGEITHFIGIQNDISARVEAEQQRTRNERRYRQMFEGSGAIALLIDPQDGRIRDANPAACNFYGYSHTEMTELTVFDLNPLPEAEVRARMREANASPTREFHFRHRLRSGELRDIRAFSSPVDMPEGRLLYAVITDVTSEQHAQAERENLLAHLAFLNQTAFDLISLPDEESIYTYMGQQLYGLLDGEVIVLVNRMTEDGSGFQIQGAYGVDETQLGRIMRLMGYSPVGKIYVNDPQITRYFEAKRLVKFEGGLVALAKKVVPPVITRQIVRLLNLGEVYLSGLVSQGVLYAGIQLYMRGGRTIDQPDLIEAFIQQASTAVQRIKAIDSLRASEARYRALFEQSNDAVFILGLDGRHQFVNQRGLDLLGYSLDEIKQLSCVDTAMPDERHQNEDVLARLLAEEHIPPYERNLRHSKGYAIPAEISVELVRDSDGEPLHIQSVVRDISERKRMEDALRRSEALYRMLSENSSDSISLHRPDGRFLYVNHAHAGITGYTLEEMYAFGPQELAALVHPDDLPRTRDEAHAQARRGQRITQLQYRVRRKDGSYVWVENNSVPIVNANGEVEQILATTRDISERKRMEDALRASEERFRAFIEQSSDGVVMIDEAGRITTWNPSMAAMTGIPVEDALGEHLWDVQFRLGPQELRTEAVYAQIKAMTLDLLEKGAASWSDTPMESRVVRPDGDERAVQAVMFPIQTEDGYRAGSILRDVTKQRAIEEELRRSEEWLRSLIGSASAFLIRTDMDGNYSYVNQAFADWFDTEPEALLGRPIMEGIHVLDREQADRAGLDAVAQPGKPVQVSLRKTLADGELRHTLWEFIALTDKDQNVVEIQCMGFDVSEQHRVEEALRQSEERLRTIVDSIPIMISFFDQQGRFEYVNRCWVDVLGYTAEELAARDDPLEVFYPDPDYRREALNYMLAAEPDWRDFQTLTKDGEILTTTWANVRLSDGRSIGIGRDVTAIRQAEQHKIELTLEQERRRLLTTFIQHAAHEFRTPLATINSSAYLMQRSDDAGRRAEKHAQIEKEVERITRLVETLLLLVRVEGSVLKQERVAIEPLLNDLCETLRYQYGEQPALDCDIAPDLPDVVGSSDDLHDALVQVIDNAYRFTPAEGHISVTASAAADQVHISVRDTGPGISQAVADRVFETFWRADSAHSTPGFGLGLPIARRIIERHAGTLTLASTSGEGTHLVITLPAAPSTDHETDST